MILKILLYSFLILSTNCLAQSQQFTNGIYLNFAQLQNRAPEYEADLEVHKRSNREIKAGEEMTTP